MGLVSTSTTPMLLKLVAQQKLAAEKFATHRFGFDQMIAPTTPSAGPRRPRRSRW